jgi:uncharacterized protein (TIGR00297 family)
MQIILGLILGTLIAFVAYQAGALDLGGAFSAAAVGGLIFGLGGFPWAALLLLFFISSSLLSRAFERQKSAVSEKFAKGSRRDYGQVLANGGVGVLLALLHALYPALDSPWIAFVGAMAAVTADTWATEVGVLSRTAPVLISTGARVEKGTSGGVSLVGSLASLAGAFAVGLAAVLFSATLPFGLVLLAAGGGGMAGAVIDSLLGATVQGIYYCPCCEKETESHPRHRCGTLTVQLRGWRWLNNDRVNLLCSLAGAIFALAVWVLLPG